MRRLIVPLFALIVAERGVAAEPQPVVDEPRSLLDRAFEGLAAGLSEVGDWIDAPDLIRFQVELRDLLRAAGAWLVASGAADPHAPDLTALTSSPVPEVESSGYGWRDDPVRGNRKFHKGTDFKADRGTPVLAAGDGIVGFVGWQRGYGRVIYVDHGGGLITRYAHLARIDVATGDVIAAAIPIGRVGASGRVTGPHLHFEVRVDGRAVDPVLAMRVATLQRTSPEFAAGVAIALSPQIQAHALDASDRTNQRRARTQRAVSGLRSAALW
jgi:murein DD-endopeptidase MepM/ murein hydrolase activator NlpD